MGSLQGCSKSNHICTDNGHKFFDENINAALGHVESQLDRIAESSAFTLALRSGIRWREQGEQSNTYFYRTIKTRSQKQAIHELQTSDGHIVQSPQEFNDCTKQFYEKLYSPNEIHQDAIEELLGDIPSSANFDENTTKSLTSQWTGEDLAECMSKTLKRSSPGVDGIPYKILQLLFIHPFCRGLFTKVLNIALEESKLAKIYSCIIAKKKKKREIEVN
ncbi:unnamed protein product [Rhizopus stolonifer]